MLSFLFDKTPEEIVRWYENKERKISYNWREVWQEAHAKAFTVAKAMDLDLLKDMQEEVTRAIETGQTYEEFRRNLEPRLKARGWWGKIDQQNPETGEMETIQAGSPRRLKTIYRTNVSVAYSSGRYKQFLANADNRPFWQYDAVMDARTRPEHGKLDKKVFRYDDPFWDTHFPPNDWNCRCSVIALNDADLKAEGLKVEKDSGKWKTKVPAGEGWNYNPGMAYYKPNMEKYEYKLGIQYVKDMLNSPAFEYFYDLKDHYRFPVGVLDNELKKLFESENKTVYLSYDTLLKNKKNHPELTIEDYRFLPVIIDKANTIIKSGDVKYMFIRRDDRLLLAVVKATQDKKELFCTSFRYTNPADIEYYKKKGIVINE